jgi:hypothetical protein
MGGRLGLDRHDVLELDVLVAQVLEHPRPASEQHRDEVNRELVDESRADVLLTGSGAAHHRYILIAGCGPRLLERALDAFGDKGVDAALRRVIRHIMREHEDRDAGGARWAVRAPPCDRGVVGAPTAITTPVHLSGS